MDVIKIKEYSAFRVCRKGESQNTRDGNYTTLTEKTFIGGKQPCPVKQR